MEEGAERWLISYSDLITTLMVLFLALYVLELSKNKDFEIRRLAVSGGVHPASVAKADGAPSLTPEQEHARSQLMLRLADLQNRKQITVTNSSKGIEIGIDARILFNSGDAALVPRALVVLREVASALRGQPGNVLVEGHTDSVPIKNAKYESNWELSSARAGSVVRCFVENGVEPHRLAAVGRADNFPLVLGNDTAAQSLNRRVTILVQY